VQIPEAIWIIFLFALGASVGSFLNVVVYRLPHELSLIRPASHCVACKEAIDWYNNLPILSWFILRGRCRHCGAGFSIRYALVELFTALLFVGLYWVYFQGRIRGADLLPTFERGGWILYGGHIFLICALLASSLIDGEHWIIPLSISYSMAVTGLVLSMVWPYCLTELAPADLWRVIPYAGAQSGAVGLGAALGLAVGLWMMKKGYITRSFAEWEAAQIEKEREQKEKKEENEQEIEVDIRREMVREIAFLTPAVALGLIFMVALTGENELGGAWERIIQEQKWLAGLLGSVFGFMIGGAVVWGTRILGSLAFGREAMGLGDVHLMAGVGAVLGWVSPTIAFFVAPFMGLGWALARLALHRSREIPYGPFLSMATVLVMVFYDPMVRYLERVLMIGSDIP